MTEKYTFNSNFDLEDGSCQYGLHFEVVAYENGCNVWHIVPGKEKLPEIFNFRQFSGLGC